MRTRSTLLWILTLLLSIVSVNTIQAQEKQDALYIYRNDGKFSAFFFGDIKSIEYSKVDTLGVEQADYVVQEIHALDSVFRIPISAIDSVAFVSPETKYKPDVFMPEKSISNYITASDSVYWILLAKNTPKSLIPKKGDKLLIEEESKFIPDGFGGLVTAVEESSEGYKVTTSALPLTDFYEYLVVKVAGASKGMDTPSRTRGALDGVDIAVPEEEITIPSVSGTLSLKKSQALLPDNSYVELNGEIQGSLSSSINTKMRLRAFLTITPFTGLRYYQETFIDSEIENAAALTGGLSGRLEAPLLPTPIHTFKKGKLKFELGVGLFLEAQATALSLTLKNSKVQHTRVNVTMDQEDIGMSITGIPTFNPFYRWVSVIEKDTTEFEINTTGQYSLGFGVFAKAEAKFSIPVEKTPKFVQAWAKKDSLGFKATLGLDVGSKLEYAGPVVTSVPTNLLETVPIYSDLNKGSIAASAYFKFVAGLSCFGWTAEYSPEVKLWEPINRGLVADITGIKVAQDEEQPIRPYRLLLSSTTNNRKVLMPNKLGFAVFDADKKLEKDSLCAFYWVGKNKENWEWGKQTNAYDAVFKLDPGKDDYKSYVAYPLVEVMGKKLLADQKYEFKLDPARIEISEREIFIGKDLGSKEIEVVPNMENMEVKAEADWLNEYSPSWIDDMNQLTIYWPDLPNNVKDRRGVIRLTGKSQKGETLVVDSIVVVQYEPYLELTPNKLEFSAEGGTKTVTIGKTNLKDISVRTNSEDIKVTLEGKVITVKMEKNTTDQQRGGSVIVEGKASNGKTVSFSISVTQKEGKPAPQGGGDLMLSAYSVESATRGEDHVVDVIADKVKGIKVKMADDSPVKNMLVNVYEGWNVDHYVARFKTTENSTREDRYAVLEITATLEDGSKQTARVVIFQKGYFDINLVEINPNVRGSAKYKDREVEKSFLHWMRFPEYPSNNGDVCSHKTTINDDGSIHYEASKVKDYIESYSNYHIQETYSFSFDLPGGLDTEVMNNLEIKYVHSEDGYVEEDILFKATNIPIKKVYETSSLKRVTFEATESNGAVFSELVYKTDNRFHPDPFTYTLKHTDTNKITLEVDLDSLPPYSRNYPW